MQRLERGQRLVVIGAEQRIITHADGGREQAVGGERTIDDDAFFGELGDRGHHDPLFLAAELAVFAGMRIESGQRDARVFDAEIAF